MKIAAVQLEAIFADVQANLIKSEKLIFQAKASGCELVLLPEFFTTAIGYSDKMLDAVHENRSVRQQMERWASEYQVIIGGSYIIFDGKNAYNRFDLIFPNGDVYSHNKDIPTQFENCYYTNGNEEHILHTPIGEIGVALCWEQIRYDTLRRLSGKVDIVLAGSCWWDLQKDIPPERLALKQYNQKLALETPVRFAKMLGVSVIHASHCGEVIAWNFPGGDQETTREFVGGAQVIDGQGQVLARRRFSEGEGFVLTEVSWDREQRPPEKHYPKNYWIPDLPASYTKVWEMINPLGKQYYESIALPYYKRHQGGLDG